MKNKTITVKEMKETPAEIETKHIKKMSRQYMTHTVIVLVLAVLVIGFMAGLMVGKLSSNGSTSDRRDGSGLRDGSTRQRGGPGMRTAPQAE